MSTELLVYNIYLHPEIIRFVGDIHLCELVPIPHRAMFVSMIKEYLK